MRDEISGTTIAGRYRIVETLGRGGLGTVYKALDMRVSKIVALKILRSEFVGDRDLETLIEEFTVLASLSHPNIIKTYDCAKTGDLVYITLEYVEGRSLAQILTEGKPLDLDAAIGIVRQVGMALDYAHRKNFVHRDVKPANILISKDGRVLLSDFGLARPRGVSTLTATGTIVGTLAYMSPEHAMGKPLDARSDVFSLGVVLYQLLTGRQPFLGDSPEGTLKNLFESDLPPPTVFNPLIDRSLQDLVMKALVKDREQRFSSMHLFVEALGLIEARLGTGAILKLANMSKDTGDEAASTQIFLHADEDTSDSSNVVKNMKDFVGDARTEGGLGHSQVSATPKKDEELVGRRLLRDRLPPPTMSRRPVDASGGAGAAAQSGSTLLLPPALPSERNLASSAKINSRLWIAAIVGAVLVGYLVTSVRRLSPISAPRLPAGPAPILLASLVVVGLGVVLWLIYRFVKSPLGRNRPTVSDGSLDKVACDDRVDLLDQIVGESRLGQGSKGQVNSMSGDFSQFLDASPTTETTPHITVPLSSSQIQLTEPSALAWLLVLNGGLRGRQFRLADTFTIGRSSQHDLCLATDSYISRTHARIALEDGRFYIYNLGSKTGTKVNGESVDRKELRDRDEIRIGNYALLFISAVSPADLTLEAKRRLQDFDALWEGLVRSVRHD